jgi:hypothetical protein
MCDTPTTLITVHFDLVQHFIEDTLLQRKTSHCSLSNSVVMLPDVKTPDVRLLR